MEKKKKYEMIGFKVTVRVKPAALKGMHLIYLEKGVSQV